MPEESLQTASASELVTDALQSVLNTRNQTANEVQENLPSTTMHETALNQPLDQSLDWYALAVAVMKKKENEQQEILFKKQMRQQNQALQLKELHNDLNKPLRVEMKVRRLKLRRTFSDSILHHIPVAKIANAPWSKK